MDREFGVGEVEEDGSCHKISARAKPVEGIQTQRTVVLEVTRDGALDGVQLRLERFRIEGGRLIAVSVPLQMVDFIHDQMNLDE